jgi:hypothetical protein
MTFCGRIVVVLVIAWMSSIVPVNAQEPVSSSSIQILKAGDSVEGAFEGEVTARLYGFNASAGDLITVRMTQAAGSELDPFVIVLGSGGEVIASDDDSGTDAPFSAAISNVLLPVSGSYLILATSFVYIDTVLAEDGNEITEPQTYTLSIEGITPPTGLEGFDETALALNTTPLIVGDTITGESTAENPVAFFTFDTPDSPSDTTVNISLLSEEFDPILHVFAQNGDRVAVNDDADELTLNSELILPATSGSYLVFATNVFFYNAQTIGEAGTQTPSEVMPYTGGAFTLSVTE